MVAPLSTSLSVRHSDIRDGRGDDEVEHSSYLYVFPFRATWRSAVFLFVVQC